MTLLLPDGTIIDESKVERGELCDGEGCDAFLLKNDNAHDVEVKHYDGNAGANTNSPPPSRSTATLCDDCVNDVLAVFGSERTTPPSGSE